MNRVRLIASIFFCGVYSVQFSDAQTASKSASISLVQSDWKPINKFPNPESSKVQSGTEVAYKPSLINTINGVTFYKKDGKCDGQDVTFVKVLNVNYFPVKISWKKGVNEPDEYVVIPANKEVIGSCQENNKLVITLPNDKSEKEKVSNYMISSITVNEARN